MTKYTIRSYGRQGYTSATIQFLTKELEAITAQAVKYGIPRHTLLTRAIKLGLPQVFAQLELTAARAQAQERE